jgi:hypothetical protein
MLKYSSKKLYIDLWSKKTTRTSYVWNNFGDLYLKGDDNKSTHIANNRVFCNFCLQIKQQLNEDVNLDDFILNSSFIHINNQTTRFHFNHLSKKHNIEPNISPEELAKRINFIKKGRNEDLYSQQSFNRSLTLMLVSNYMPFNFVNNDRTIDFFQRIFHSINFHQVIPSPTRTYLGYSIQ